MPAGNLAVAFGALLAGAVVLDYGVKNAKGAFGSSSQVSAGSGQSNSAAAVVGGFPASVNPLPGASASRLDQGIDATGSTFVSPWAGRIVYAATHDAGWKGGGYIAVQSDTDPNMVYYLAEGITPIVKQGQRVAAGDRIAFPATNPYNGITGNVEAGRANPANPRQPLAQVVSNAAGMVDDFAAWLAKLGGPKPTSTGSAGSA